MLAEQLDDIVSDEEDPDIRAKLDMTEDVLLENMNVSPASAKVLAEHIFNILDTGLLRHRKWKHVCEVLSKSVSLDHRFEDEDNVKQQLPSLAPVWDQLLEGLLEEIPYD